MTDDQKKVLLDMQAFIQFALDKDLDFLQTLATLGHDTTGLLKNQFNGKLMCPRTAGYRQKVHDPYAIELCGSAGSECGHLSATCKSGAIEITFWDRYGKQHPIRVIDVITDAKAYVQQPEKEE